MLVAVVALSVAFLLIALAMVRVLRNVGPLSLEEAARRTGIVYLPVSRQVATELAAWSKPVRIRIEQKDHPLLATLVLNSNLEEA